ncbi:MAG: ABC transporter permease [Steroidobacteraceae bacterium]
MNNWLTQVIAITWMSIRNIPQRLAPSIVAAVGVAGVVMVLVGVLSMREGFRAVLNQSGADDIAIVMRTGSTDEMGSNISQAQVRIVEDAASVARDSKGAISSPELYVVVDVPLRNTGTPANVPLRGVGPRAMELRQNFRIAEGRTFRPGTFEVIVGRGASLQFSGLELGKQLRWGTTQWQVVGIFDDRGSVAESEIWTDVSVLQGAYNRGSSYQSQRVRLTSANALQSFRDSLSTDPRLNMRVLSERKYYEEKTETLVALVTVAGGTIGFLMGLGAIFGALNTMYSAVSARTREIATLRALGFGATPVVISVLAEAMLLGVAGGIVGGLLAYLGFNGIRASTMSGFNQMTFAFAVSPELLLQGLLYALILGFIGGLLPSLRAARMGITEGLREL